MCTASLKQLNIYEVQRYQRTTNVKMKLGNSHDCGNPFH